MQKLAGEVTDDSLPRVYPADALLAKGSLLLIDFGKSDNQQATVPPNNTVIKNLAWDIAKTMIPTGTETTLSTTVRNSLQAGNSLAEVTPKKGIHVIISKVSDQVALQNDFELNHAALIKNYLLDQPTHEFYASYWTKRTRVSDTTVSGDFYLERNTSNAKFAFQSADEIPLNSGGQAAMFLGRRSSPATLNTVSNYYRSIGFKGFLGTIDTDRNLLYLTTKVGSSSPYSGQEQNKAPSMIIYRIYIEDLTVSGRTYAQVDAIDKSLYDAAFAVGGKFYGDTHTDPATLP